MAIQSINTTPNIKLISEPKPYYRNPMLYVVGMWSSFSTLAGDASGGAGNMQFYPLPANPVLPLLPKLQAWWTILAIGFDNNSSGMQTTLTARSNFTRSGWDYQNFKSAKAQVGNADGTYCWAGDEYKEWQMFYSTETLYRGLRFDWISNDNGKTYNGACCGLLLKDKDQLIGEGLWSRKFE